MTTINYRDGDNTKSFTIETTNRNMITFDNLKSKITRSLSGFVLTETAANGSIQCVNVPLISMDALKLVFPDLKSKDEITLDAAQAKKLLDLFKGTKNCGQSQLNDLNAIYKAFESEVHDANKIMDNFMAEMIKTAVGLKNCNTCEKNFEDLATALEKASAAYSYRIGNVGLAGLGWVGALVALLVDALAVVWSQFCRVLNPIFVSEKTQQEVKLKWAHDGMEGEKPDYETMQALLVNVQNEISAKSITTEVERNEIIGGIVAKSAVEEGSKSQAVKLLESAINGRVDGKYETRLATAGMNYAMYKVVSKNAQVADKKTKPFYKSFVEAAQECWSKRGKVVSKENVFIAQKLIEEEKNKYQPQQNKQAESNQKSQVENGGDDDKDVEFDNNLPQTNGCMQIFTNQVSKVESNLDKKN